MVARPYGELVEACVALVRDKVFSRRSQSAMLARAIAETSL
jgi:hypothetical protein